MALTGKINSLKKRVEALQATEAGLVMAACGVWYRDAAGEIVPGSGPMQRVTRGAVFGVLVVGPPLSHSDWEEKCGELHAKIVSHQAESRRTFYAALSGMESNNQDGCCKKQAFDQNEVQNRVHNQAN